MPIKQYRKQDGFRCVLPILRRLRPLQVRQNPVGLGTPIGAARELLRSALAEQPAIREIGDPRLPLGRALRRPWREARLAHGLGHLADLLSPAPAVLDHALEEIGALLLPI